MFIHSLEEYWPLGYERPPAEEGEGNGEPAKDPTPRSASSRSVAVTPRKEGQKSPVTAAGEEDKKKKVIAI